jgi:hypothetical protein
MLKKLLPVLCLPLLLAGCATPFVVTNLTSSQQTRSTNNLYMVEAAVASNQQSLRWDSIKPQIVVGDQVYPMKPTRLMENRWEGLVPVPAGTDKVRYHYRFNFMYNAWGGPRQDCVTSPSYTLRVLPE